MTLCVHPMVNYILNYLYQKSLFLWYVAYVILYNFLSNQNLMFVRFLFYSFFWGRYTELLNTSSTFQSKKATKNIDCPIGQHLSVCIRFIIPQDSKDNCWLVCWKYASRHEPHMENTQNKKFNTHQILNRSLTLTGR